MTFAINSNRLVVDEWPLILTAVSPFPTPSAAAKAAWIFDSSDAKLPDSKRFRRNSLSNLGGGVGDGVGLNVVGLGVGLGVVGLEVGLKVVGNVG